MSRNYECILVVDTVTTDVEKEGVVKKIKEVLAQNQGEIEKIEEWGRRELSYPINKKREGNYLWLALKGNPEVVKDLESYFKLNEKILRHLILTRKVSAKIKIQKVKPKEMPQAPAPQQVQSSENEQR